MADKRKTPELLAPAGDMERLKMAVLYGADAVYLAGTSFGMRAFAGNFSPEELKTAVDFAHAHGVAVHCTINTMPRGDEIVRLPEHLEQLNDVGVDAVIVADLGAFTLAGKYDPNCKRHISTQASISNYVTANAWHDLGASRVILARELSLEEIRTIREKTPADLEIEAFVHGAMCVSYSGRCLLSNYMTGRDASRGACAQPCRYHYALMDPVWRDEVEHVSHRPYATGFYYGYPGQYYANSRYIREWQVVALVTECDENGDAVISLRNKFRTGDTVELVGPDLRPFAMTVPEMRDESGAVVEEPRNPQMLLKLRLPRQVPPMTLMRHQVELSAK